MGEVDWYGKKRRNRWIGLQFVVYKKLLTTDMKLYSFVDKI